MVSVSVIMPALNEAANIRQAIEATLSALAELSLDGEIIVVNDGSIDETAEIAGAFKSIKLLNHEKTLGVGQSFWDGVAAATKEVVVFIPGDNENDPYEVFSFLELLSEVDIVVPFIYNIEVRNKFRRLLSSMFRVIMNLSFGIHLNYTNGTVLYRRSIFKGVELKSRGFLYQAELLVKLIRGGYLYAEVPHFLGQRRGSKSKAVSLKSLWSVITGYWQLIVDIHIKRSAGTVGLPVASDSVTFKRRQRFKQ